MQDWIFMQALSWLSLLRPQKLWFSCPHYSDTLTKSNKAKNKEERAKSITGKSSIQTSQEHKTKENKERLHSFILCLQVATAFVCWCHLNKQLLLLAASVSGKTDCFSSLRVNREYWRELVNSVDVEWMKAFMVVVEKIIPKTQKLQRKTRPGNKNIWERWLIKRIQRALSLNMHEMDHTQHVNTGGYL